MKGSKREIRPGVWRLRAYTGRRDSKGHPVLVSRTFHGGPRQSDSALAAFVTEVETKQLGRHGATVGDLLDSWLRHIEPERAGYTLKGYRQKIDGRIRPALGNIRVDALRARQLDQAYRAWLDDGLSPTTVRQCHAILAAALHQAVKWEWIPINPAENATAPSARRPRPSSPTIPEFQSLLAAGEEQGDSVLSTAMAIAAVTGARRGELCALRWSDWDPDTGTLTVARSLTVIDRQAVEGPTKTHQLRRLALDPLGQAELERRWAGQLAYAAEVGVRLVADPFILSRSARGDLPCLPDGLTHGFGRICARLGLSYHFHQLRNFAASVSIAGGADPRSVANRLGHANPSMTLNRYAGSFEARDQEIAAVLGGTLRALPSVVEGDGDA